MTTIFSTKKSSRISGKIQIEPPPAFVTKCIVSPMSMGWSQFGQRLFFTLIYVDWHQSITGKFEKNRKEESIIISSPWILENLRENLEELLRLQNRFPLGIKVLSHTIKALRNDKRAFKGLFKSPWNKYKLGFEHHRKMWQKFYIFRCTQQNKNASKLMIIILCLRCFVVVFPLAKLPEKKCNDSNQNESNPKNHFLVATTNYRVLARKFKCFFFRKLCFKSLEYFSWDRQKHSIFILRC